MRKDTLSEESHVSTGLWTAPDKHGRFLADTPSAKRPFAAVVQMILVSG